jgi:hypothetical protein
LRHSIRPKWAVHDVGAMKVDSKRVEVDLRDHRIETPRE